MLPRLAIVYPIYAVGASLLALDVGGIKDYWLKALALFVVTITALMYVNVFYSVSVVAYLLEFILFLPLFFVAMGSARNWKAGSDWIVTLNYLTLIASLINLVLFYKFPFQLPYVHYLPDAISAFWGLGGAKIVTVIGFFGLLSALLKFQRGETVSRYLVAVGLINFLAPSYNIGILAGVFGFALSLLVKVDARKIALALAGFGVFLMFVAPYISERLLSLNLLFYYEFNMHPKVYSFYSIYDMFKESPSLILTGVGLGNFSGAAAIWSSEYLAMISTHSNNLPGLFESELHRKYLAPALSIIVDDPWSLSSSFNKPYSTASTLIAELGLVMFVLLVFKFLKSLQLLIVNRAFYYIVIGFLVVIFLVDNIHTNPLFLASVLIGLRGVMK